MRYFKHSLWVIFLVLFLSISLNIGKYLDITQPPQQADMIVCLGGGWTERLDKTSQLYNLGFSKVNKIILTGTLIGKLSENDLNGFYKIPYLQKQGVDKNKIIFAGRTYNTYQEVLFIKNYMIRNNYQSVIFVSDPPHSRRIAYLANYMKYKDANLSYVLVGSNVDWWDRIDFYKNKIALKESMKEISKLVHHTFVYN